VTAIVVLAALTTALLVPLAVAAIRQRSLLTMAARNIGRRRGEAALVVGGALLGTAIITSSFVVGDVIEGSFRDVARTQYGPVDITLTSTGDASPTDVAAAVEAADVDGVEGLLATTVSTVTLEAQDRGTAAPRVRVVELDLDAARRFGGDPEATGVADLGALAADRIALNARTADDLGAEVGDTLRVHAAGDATDLVVADVVAEVGLAGYGGAIVAPGALTGATDGGPQHELLVTLDGGVMDTRELSDAAVADLRSAVAGLPDVEVAAPKAAVLDDATREGDGFTELFSIIGSFSVLAGILLLVNLFVMLAEERKTELGMLRAVGFTRRRLTRAFALEGAIYAVVAAAVGAAVGVGIGWVVAVLAGTVLGHAGELSGFPMVVEPVSLATGALTGLVISLVTIWATSLRIARLNVIRAIRDLPEPPRTQHRRRHLVLAGAGVLLGTLLGVAGYLAADPIALLLGVPVAAFAATPLLRRRLPERPSRLLAASAVLAWGLGVWVVFPATMNVDGNPALFVLQGVVLTAGAVSLVAGLDRVWAAALGLLGRRGGGLAPRLGVAYPLARRFRTSMLLSMFSLVIFTVTILASVSATFARSTEVTATEVAAGFDVLLDTNPADPADLDRLAARDGVTAVAGLVRGVAEFEAAHLEGTRPWTVTGFDADLLARGTPLLMDRDEAYASDAAAYQAVLDDPTKVIVPEGFLAGVGGAEVRVGDTIGVVDGSDGRARTLTVVGLGDMDWLGNGAFVGRDLAASLLGQEGVVARTYLAVDDGVEAAEFAASLDHDLLAQGAEAHAIPALVADAVGQQTGLLALLQGFLGLGLLVGTAGLGVVMVRSVRERRRDIGTLRALGLRTGQVRAALLSEAGLITVQGTIIGAALGLLTTRHLLAEIGDQLSYTVPWLALVVIVGTPIVASLAATAWPASRAAAIRPAVALRAAD
jgi:putative ABC transport system permease protein